MRLFLRKFAGERSNRSDIAHVLSINEENRRKKTWKKRTTSSKISSSSDGFSISMASATKVFLKRVNATDRKFQIH